MCGGARLVAAHRGHMRAGGGGRRRGNGGLAGLDLVTATATTTATALAHHGIAGGRRQRSSNDAGRSCNSGYDDCGDIRLGDARGITMLDAALGVPRRGAARHALARA